MESVDAAGWSAVRYVGLAGWFCGPAGTGRQDLGHYIWCPDSTTDHNILWFAVDWRAAI